MSDVIDKVRSRGYWDVVIRPATYIESRVPYAELEGIIQAAEVRLRGWPVPFYDNRERPIRRGNWVGQDIDAEMVGHYEAWRFHTSGQFNQLRAVDADWRHTSKIQSSEPGREKVIQVWEILFYLTEVFELASRLTTGPAGDDAMVVEATLHGLQDRRLIVGQHNRAEFYEPHHTDEDVLRREIALSRSDLIASTNEQSVKMASEFFARFGWKPSLDQLAGHQRELLEMR
jgi:hypothetical protein